MPRSIEFTAAQIDEMVALYRHGWSCDRLAERFGCLSGSIHRRLLSRGVEMRPKHQARRTATIHSNGYVMWGQSYVHRIVAEAMLERPLSPGEVVHHKDGNKRNDHPDNLEVFASHAAHMRAERWRTFWTPDRQDTLVTMRAAGRTAKEIAAALGTTKYAVDNAARDLVAAGITRSRSGWRGGCGA